jgi:hypothetical protein
LFVIATNRHSVRVLYNGRRWWYQPQALLPEKSGLTESPGVWFIRAILRAHGYDHTTLHPLLGKQVTTGTWQVGDIVVPMLLSDDGSGSQSSHEQQLCFMESCVGRIVAETSSSTSSLTVRGRDSGTVLVEYVDTAFAEAADAQVGSGLQDSDSSLLETRRVRVSKLLHSSVFHGATPLLPPSKTPIFPPRQSSQSKNSGVEPMDASSTEMETGAVSDKLMSDIKKMRRLDLNAIENVTKECKHNPAALAGIFSAGLPDAVIAAVDCAEKKLQNSDDGETLAQAISALGRLAVVVAEKLFPGVPNDSIDTNETHESSEDAPSAEANPAQEEESIDDPEYLRNNPRDPRSLRVSSALMQEAGRAGRLSSLQQRRNMLLSLMSRARRGNAGLNDFLSRETNGEAREFSLGHMMPALGPFRQDAAAALLFGPPGELELGRSFEDLAGAANEEQSRRTASSSGPTNNRTRQAPRQASRPIPSFGSQQEGDAPFLETILRGRSGKLATAAAGGKGLGSIQPATLRALISNGFLGNSLVWVKAALDSQSKKVSLKDSQRGAPVFQTATDEEETPLLQLAISLGCSASILKHLIRHGAQVGENDIIRAAKSDQPEALSILLQYAVYSEGLVDLQTCSPTVAKVIQDASSRQTDQERKMRQEAGTLMVTLVRRLVELGLVSRRRHDNKMDLCSRAIAGALVGNVLLRALHKRQQDATSGLRAVDGSRRRQSQNQPDSSTRGRSGSDDAYAALSSTPPGLLYVLPKEMIGESLLMDVFHVTGFLLLVEDYLCSKDINDGAIGLTLLSTLLKIFPFFSACSEIERYGFSELVSSHDAFASNRLADISSSIASAASSDKSPGFEAIAVSGVVLCPKRHAAALHVTRHSSFRCDLCSKGVERGRVMHGCRECDWDACERCTDKAESGIVKWNFIRQLASECQRLMSPGTVPQEEDKTVDEFEKVLESLIAADNSSEVNNLSIRLLQRDHESIKEFALILSSRGRLTVHQFLTVILPSLHASLLGGSWENGRLRVSGTAASRRTSRRTKKPRVVGSSSRETEEASHVHQSDDRLLFCKEVVKCLIQKSDEKGPTSQQRSAVMMDSANENSEDEGSDDGGDADDSEGISVSKALIPEFLRRLHQVLSLYENLAQHTPHGAGPSGLKGCDLQALKMPLEVRLLPSASRKRSKTNQSPSHSMSVQAEPLMTVADLELHVLRTCKVSHPSYVAFCRRLVSIDVYSHYFAD